MNILVLGAGAIGLVFGGFLAKSGHRVILLGREKIIEPINKMGLVIDGILGTHHVMNIKGYANLLELIQKEDSRFDLALLTVKTYDTEVILKTFIEIFPSPIPIISLQNGLGNVEQIIKFVGRDLTMVGRVIFSAEIPKEPWKVTVTVCAEEVRIAGISNGIAYSRVKQVADLFYRAGIPTLPTQEIEKYTWGEVLYNCSLNGLGTILGVKYGLLIEHESTRILIADTVKEIFQILERKLKKMDWSNPEAYLCELYGRLIPRTCECYPSMLRDILNKKRTEIDAFNGAIVKIAHEYAFDVPVNWLITKLVKVKEKIALGIKDK